MCPGSLSALAALTPIRPPTQELVADPTVLFLDEPTSGLDSTSSLAVLQALKRLAQLGGMTIVAVLHQPRYEIFEMFDEILLLAKGGACLDETSPPQLQTGPPPIPTPRPPSLFAIFHSSTHSLRGRKAASPMRGHLMLLSIVSCLVCMGSLRSCLQP